MLHVLHGFSLDRPNYFLQMLACDSDFMRRRLKWNKMEFGPNPSVCAACVCQGAVTVLVQLQQFSVLHLPCSRRLGRPACLRGASRC